VARPLIALAALTSLGCFHSPGYSPQRSVAAWREMEAARPPGAASRPDRPAADDLLTADQAYQLALANNPDLAVVAAEAAVAEAEIGAAKQLENPTLRLTNFAVDDTVPGKAGFNLGVRAPIPRPGTVHARVKQARLAAESAQGTTDAARGLLRAEIDRRYARLALLQADIEEVSRAAALGETRRAQLKDRVEKQVATRVDLALAELDHAETQEELNRLRDEQGQIEAELARLIGPGPPRRYAVDRSELRVGDARLTADALTEQALRARPELRAAQTRVGEAQAAVYIARSEVYPWLSWAQVNYYFGANSTPAAFGFGLALDLPLFSWNRGEIRAAKATVRLRELEERAGVATIAAEVREAMARVERTQARIKEIETSLLPQIDAAAEAAEAALAAGALDPLKAGEVEARRVAARRLHLAALYERRAAMIDLEAALGTPLPR
jgi:outer membrane protein, heavy metal efflux system